jgi:predicted solute-binding protein
MRRLRISAISYLNTAPLMWDFENTPVGSQFEISYTIPSDCARSLETGSADIGIIPAAAYTRIPELVILPDVAIAAVRAVRSILLVSKVPIEHIRSVALDTSSMASVALTKIILDSWYGGQCRFMPMEPVIEEMLASHDAGLLIGDPALRVDRAKYHTYDLAEEWIRRTGKPFVFTGSRPRAHIPGISQSWFATGQSRAHCPAVGTAPRTHTYSSQVISAREHPLLSRSRLPRGFGSLLQLRPRVRCPTKTT